MHQKMNKNRSILSPLLLSLVLDILAKIYVLNILTYLNAGKEKTQLYSVQMV